jgi:hypothetical protein
MAYLIFLLSRWRPLATSTLFSAFMTSGQNRMNCKETLIEQKSVWQIRITNTHSKKFIFVIQLCNLKHFVTKGKKTIMKSAQNPDFFLPISTPNFEKKFVICGPLVGGFNSILQ